MPAASRPRKELVLFFEPVDKRGFDSVFKSVVTAGAFVFVDPVWRVFFMARSEPSAWVRRGHV